LDELSDYQTRVELAIERENLDRLRVVYEKRRDILKNINNFWGVAFLKHNTLPVFIQHNADQTALSYLEDVWVERDQTDHRCFTLEMHFKENQFFSDRVLKKEYKYKPAAEASNEPDENGITEAMVKFDWETDVEASAIKINWKDADKALTKVYPRVTEEDEDEDPSEPGSFFNFFELGPDPFEIGNMIANDVFPEAIDHFLGKNEEGVESDDEESDDESEEDAEEIDLEKPRTKKRRV